MIWAVVAGAVVLAAIVWAVVARNRVGAKRSFAALGAREIAPGEQPRLSNMVEGLASDLGVAPPLVGVLDDDEANAFVIGGRSPSIGFTTGLVAGYTRTELEAVVAHCLVRVQGRGAIRPAGLAEDIASVTLTRYPPALASALRKASPRPERAGVRWFVPEGGDPSTEQRAVEVLDL
ncbi:MAG: heat shock protein HtpX [Actinomycetota bacterium]|nr:heat shock protein HtpX [Actinomycetota bacterium]